MGAYLLTAVVTIKCASSPKIQFALYMMANMNIRENVIAKIFDILPADIWKKTVDKKSPKMRLHRKICPIAILINVSCQ